MNSVRRGCCYGSDPCSAHAAGAVSGERRVRVVRGDRLMRGVSAALLRGVFAVGAPDRRLPARQRSSARHALPPRREPDLAVRPRIVARCSGRCAGVCLAPLAQTLFEVELNEVESAIEHLAPSELAGGAIGLIVGLVIAFLVKSVLFEFLYVRGPGRQLRRDRPLYPRELFAAYLGARVGAKQRVCLAARA